MIKKLFSFVVFLFFTLVHLWTVLNELKVKDVIAGNNMFRKLKRSKMNDLSYFEKYIYTFLIYVFKIISNNA